MTNYTDWQMEFIEKPDLPKWVRVSFTLVHIYVFASIVTHKCSICFGIEVMPLKWENQCML